MALKFARALAAATVIAVGLSFAIMPASGQWPNHRTAGLPRTDNGKPNLSALAPRGTNREPGIERTASQRAKQQVSIVGTWERVFQTDQQGQPVANPYMVVMFSGDGVFVQINIVKDRPRIDKPLGQLTNEEFRVRFTGSQAVYGTYIISGDRLLRNVVGALNPNNEGTEITSVFTIDGDTLIAKDPATRAEARFKRVPNGSLSPR